jgi:response regulator RpfG family c-di-GMP phosphodiesterase/GGDEF domain-containing protein
MLGLQTLTCAPCNLPSGLISRTQFDQVVETLKNAPSASTPLAILFLSIDRSQSIRDTFGPALWAQTLDALEAVLAQVGHSRCITRYDVDRFAALLTDANAATVDQFLNQVLSASEHTNQTGVLPSLMHVAAGSAIGTSGQIDDLLREATNNLDHQLHHATLTTDPPQPCRALDTSDPPSITLPPLSGALRPAVVLLVDDDLAILTFASDILAESGFDLRVASRGPDAVRALKKDIVDVLVTDIHLPGVDGLTVLEEARRQDPAVGVVVITGAHDLELAVRAIRGGADDFVVKPFSPADLRISVSRVLHKRRLIQNGQAYQALLQTQVEVRTQELGQVIRHLESTYRATLKALGAALDTRDVETHAHSERVASYALKLGGLLDLSEPELTTLERGVYLHDIGKIGIPDRVLLKPGKLTPDEWDIMRRHCRLGYRLASRIDFLKDASSIILTHHERWDGQGYPQGLQGISIPFGARIFAVVDTLDAITSDRPYRKAKPFGAAREEILQYSGKQFDPTVIEAFLSVPDSTWNDIRETVNQHTPATQQD